MRLVLAPGVVDPVAWAEHVLPGRAVDRQVLPVVGDGHVLISTAQCGVDHLLETGPPVARAVCVIVEVPLIWVELDESGQFTLRRRLDLSRRPPGVVAARRTCSSAL